MHVYVYVSNMKCPKCGRQSGYMRYVGRPNQEWVCQSCGEITRIDPKRKEEAEEAEEAADVDEVEDGETI